MFRTWSTSAALVAAAGGGVSASDDFEWFRCDSCCATVHKLNSTLYEEKQKRNQRRIEPFDVIEIIEDMCENGFTKNDFGVKRYQDKSYLFGPGIKDHLGPDKGFGQMGMGEYDLRLRAYCSMFIEQFGGEDEIYAEFVANKGLDETEICREECLTSASGSIGGVSKKQRKKDKQRKKEQEENEKEKAQNMIETNKQEEVKKAGTIPVPEDAKGKKVAARKAAKKAKKEKTKGVPAGRPNHRNPAQRGLKMAEDVKKMLPALSISDLHDVAEEVVKHLKQKTAEASKVEL